MSILHITHIKNDVLKYFDNLVDVSDLNPNGSGYEVNKLSRALSAYGIFTICGADPKDIAKNIIDGSDDNGIDCFFFDSSKSTMYFSQAKWDQDGKGEPSQGDVKKFTDGIRDLVCQKFDRFNNKLNSHKEEIEEIIANPNVKYTAILVYTGANELAKPANRELDDLLKEMNDASDIFSVIKLNQSLLHNNISQNLEFKPINKIIELKNWGKIDKPNKAFYGQINGFVLAQWWNEYKEQLFSKNIRNMLGDTDVNSEIKETIEQTPELFWYYNNGITIIADSIKKSIEGGGNNDFGKFTCENISIINGAQTVSTLGKIPHEKEEKVANVFVQCRIIEAGSISNELSMKITKTNNRQNKIENRDFVSQDPQQKRIRDELLPEGYNYIIQRTESSVKDEYTIDLQDSTTALSCASNDTNLVVQLKREIGKLWEDTTKPPYLKLFNPSTNSLYILRTVLIQRKIDEAISTLTNTKGLNAYEKSFYNYGNRLIAMKIFSDLPITNFSKPDFNISSISYNFLEKAQEYHDKIKTIIEQEYPNSVIPVFFRNFTKCAKVYSLL